MLHIFGLSKAQRRQRRASRRHQRGFLSLAMFLPRWASRSFGVRDLFAANEPGAHFQTYNPNDLLRRRNLLTWSEDFTNAAWTKVNSGTGTLPVVTANAGVDPLGGNAADRLQLDAGAAGQSSLGQNPSGTAVLGESQTCSVWMRSLAGDVTVTLFNTSSVQNVLVTAAWQRFSFPVGAAATNREVRIVKRDIYGSSGAADLLVWGAQLERGALSDYQKVTDWNTEYLAAALERVGLWQDNGTTPVTAVEQSVGMWMDTKLGLVRGPELSVPASWGGVSTGITKDAGAGSVSMTGAEAAFGSLSIVSSANVVVGDAFEISYTVSGYVQGGVQVNIGSATNAYVTANGTYRIIKIATAVVGGVVQENGGAGSRFIGTVSNISIRKLPGNHATQTTGGSKAVLSARYNLFTKTQEFDDAAWGKTDTTVAANAVAAPDGASTADTLTDAATSNVHRVSETVTVPLAGTKLVLSCAFKNNDRRYVNLSLNDSTSTTVWAAAKFDLQTGVVSSTNGASGTVESATVVSLGNGWYRCTLVGSVSTGTNINGFVALASDGTTYTAASRGCEVYLGTAKSVYAWGADLRTANDAALNQPAYQRVNTSTDYDTDGFIHYLKFDGTDDSYQTPSVDFSGVDKMTVWAGVTKLSDAASAMLLELSADIAGVNGAFNVTAPGSSGTDKFRYTSKGTIAADAKTTSATYSAPYSATLCGQSDIAGDSASLRINGAVAGTAAFDQGAGNFGNFPLNIGRRNNANIPFSGRVTSLTVRGSTTPASQRFIVQMEQLAARLAGQSFAST